ncbi:hypothetical protein ACSBR1_010717 [Camellia fascicularis]
MVVGHHLRMEKFDLRRPSSQAKSVGIIMAVSGPFVMTLYKRPPLLMASSPSNLPHRLLLSQQQPNWVLGGFFLGFSLGSLAFRLPYGTLLRQYMGLCFKNCSDMVPAQEGSRFCRHVQAHCSGMSLLEKCYLLMCTIEIFCTQSLDTGISIRYNLALQDYCKGDYCKEL